MTRPGTPESPAGLKKRPGPQLPPGWEHTFFEALEQRGGFFKAARKAGVSYDAVKARRDADPAFEARCWEARQYHADELEEALEDKGGYVGHIVRLKALRPNEYIERQAIVSLNVNTEVPPDLGADLLQMLLAHTTPTTRAILSHQAQPQALEAHQEPETP